VELGIFTCLFTNECVCIEGSSDVSAPADIAKHADRLKNIAAISKSGGIVLGGVGLTAACMQIGNTSDVQEKNEIFVETIMSTAAGVGLGYAVGLFLISNPIGWGSAIVLAVGSTAASYAFGKGVRYGYTISGTKIDFVSGTGTGRLCK